MGMVDAHTAIPSGTGLVGEAGTRDAPALPPGLLAEAGEAAARPTKLFIGGISRHTTTKQLRDHFAQFGRVLDCVAMRQPDGRPRGFGYVTLDSPSAAERCLREPQMIDNRIVDMKPAVPEGSGSAATSPQGSFGTNMFGGQSDYSMGMYNSHGFGAWPDVQGSYGGMNWWANGKTSPMSSGGLDCVDLLSAARELSGSQPCSPTGLALQSVGLREYGDFDQAQSGGKAPHSEEVQQAGAFGKMSASAPEFVPQGVVQAATKTLPEAADTTATPAKKAVKARAPFGDLSNIVEVEDLLKPFKSPTGKLADMGHGHLSGNESTGFRPRPTGLLLDDDEVHESSPSSSSQDGMHAPSTSSNSTPEKVEEAQLKAQDTPIQIATREQDESTPGQESKDSKEDIGQKSPTASTESDSESEEEHEPVVVDMDALPSMGSALHGTGECKRCNFFPKGRCQNGKDCTFCHYPHDKRKPSRQEKRERRAAWLDQQPQEHAAALEAAVRHALPKVAQPTGPLLGTHIMQPGCYGALFPEEDMYSDEALAYPSFSWTKLPEHLPLPLMDTSAGPALPPGLTAPTLSTQPWQSEVVSSAPLSAACLGTVPTPLATPGTSVASTPLPTPLPTPTAAKSTAASEARTTLSASTGTTTASGTQTGDYKCRKCDEKVSAEAPKDAEKHGQQWARDELLRLRDRLAKLGASENPSFKIRTTPITATTSN
jgi:hypothetical protein